MEEGIHNNKTDVLLNDKICYLCHKKGHTKYKCKRKVRKRELRDEEYDINKNIVIEGVDVADGLQPLTVFKNILKKVQMTDIKSKDYNCKFVKFDKKSHRNDEIKITFGHMKHKQIFLERLWLAGYNFYYPQSSIFRVLIEVHL